MKRGGPLNSNPEKQREWQQRGAKKAAENARDKAANKIHGLSRRVKEKATPQPMVRKQTRSRRNDGPWRNDVMARRGETCVSCGTRQNVQADHIWPRSQGGPNDVRNGMPLCGPFAKGCHDKKTAGTLRFRFEWLDAEQVAWLAEVRWVWWDDEGVPQGRGRKHFEPRSAAW